MIKEENQLLLSSKSAAKWTATTGAIEEDNEFLVDSKLSLLETVSTSAVTTGMLQEDKVIRSSKQTTKLLSPTVENPSTTIGPLDLIAVGKAVNIGKEGMFVAEGLLAIKNI